MTCLNIILVFAAVLAPGFTYVLDDAAQKCLNWPEEYHLRGEKINYDSGVITPFETWYSAARNKSRVDYDGGTVKHYYVLDEDSVKDFKRPPRLTLPHAEIYPLKVYPVTTEEVTNKIVCQESSTKGKLFSILQKDEYTFIGQRKYNDKVVDVCKYSEVTEMDENIEKKWERTLYVYQDNDGKSVPVFKEVKRHNLWTGAMDKHYVLRFYVYSLPDDDSLDHKLEESCNEMYTTINSVPLEDVQNAFDSYTIHHSKKYEGDEHKLRKQILLENRRRVVEHNKKNLSYKMTLNKFSDWTDEEMARLRGTRPSPQPQQGSMPFPHSEEEVALLAQELPKYYDMRNEGYISSVKHQDDCGSCWSFASVAAVEGALARSNGGRNLDLSEQSLIDCSWGFKTFGCSGGVVGDTYKYILKHGIPSEMEYGLYLNKEGYCKLENMTELYRIRGFAKVPELSVDAMKVALYKYGPVTVTINANDNVLYYDSGIFYDPTCNEEHINHAVSIVGYGERDGVVYWIVKNSWGEDWGQDGYILFSATDNNCHILEDAFYPVI